MARQFTAADGLVTADMIHCGLDHLTAAQLLFESDAAHFDAAGYLSHMGVELLLKGWLLEVAAGFGATHNLGVLYATLREAGHVGDLPEASARTLGLLNEFGELRYPNRNKPVEIGQDHWEAIALLASDLCNAMPEAISADAAATVTGRFKPTSEVLKVLGESGPFVQRVPGTIRTSLIAWLQDSPLERSAIARGVKILRPYVRET